MALLKNLKKQIQSASKNRDHAYIAGHVLDQAVDIASDILIKRKPSDVGIVFTPSKKLNANDKHDQTLMVVVTDDRPFLIDSVTAECVRASFSIEGVLHNTLLVEREKSGALKSVQAKTKKDDKELKRESFLVITLQGSLSGTQQKSLEKTLSDVVKDVEFATQDWQIMRDAIQDTITDLETLTYLMNIRPF